MIHIYPDKFKGEGAPKPEGAERLSYFYIHGELERKSGYDCFDSTEEKPEHGIHNALVHWPDGSSDEALLFVRKAFGGPKGAIAGIAVKTTNKKDVEWANEWYCRTITEP